MSDGLGLPNDKLSYEDNLEILKNNGIEVSKKLLNTGVTLLREKKSRVAQAVTSTSYVALSEWQAAVRCSGGIVVVWLETRTSYDGNGNLDIQLLIDGVSQREVAGLGLAANSVTNTPFIWMGELNKGNHTFKFQAKVNAGTQTVGATTSDSVLYIAEFNNGG